MSENIIYADLNLTKSTRPRLQKVTDVQGPTYAEVKVQSLDTNTPASCTASVGTSRSSRTRVAVFVALIILLLVLAVCLIILYLPTAGSSPGPKRSSNTSEEALGCLSAWERHEGKCYFFSQSEEIKDWNASRKECTEMNSDLVIIDDQDELNYLFSRSEGHYYFLGLTYFAREKKWKWINDMELSTDMFNIERNYSDYFCAVVGFGKVETESCSGSSTTRNMCEKTANILEEQKEN
ncbi:CLC5A protein, partial [Arenaria interpres]|nr:CLC5A protein [Arenaria interpres]